MLHHDETLADLQRRFPHAGRITWIGLRPEPGGTLRSVQRARLLAGRGLEGDHRARREGGRRQLTLVQAEHLQAVARMLRREALDPGLLRRNCVVAGVNLLALKGRRFRLGSALLEGTLPCHPCSRMERNLGVGGYNVMRGHGGLCAVVLEDGEIQVGDALWAGRGDEAPVKDPA